MKLKVKLYIFAVPQATEQGFTFQVLTEDRKLWASSDAIQLNEEGLEHELEVPNLSEQELLHRAIATLRERKARVYAEAERTADEIQSKIEKLLLIEYIEDEQ